ncbi:MAG: hypothetical protein LBP83_01300 [Dysgonamonadaceae bacterium]|nr:hypothetical protein [Dysgonamonadaceae bacterium]
MTYPLLRERDTLTFISKNETTWDLHRARLKVLKQKEKDILYRWITPEIAYLDLASLTSQNFDKNYNPIKDAKAIILDIRCYPSTHVILNLTNAFVPPHSSFVKISYADTRYPGMVRIHNPSFSIGKKNYYKGKIVLLVNEWTESYSEYLTMALQANPRTITIGNSSSGADGNITILEFPGKVQTCFSGIGIYYPDMTQTQRTGVKIDYIVEPTLESIKNGIDLPLEKALAVIKEEFESPLPLSSINEKNIPHIIP